MKLINFKISDILAMSGRPAFRSMEFGKKDQPFSTEISPKIATGIIEDSSKIVPLKNFPLRRNNRKVTEIRNRLSYLVNGSKAERTAKRIKSLLFSDTESSSDTIYIYKIESHMCKTCSKPVNMRGGRGETKISRISINIIAGFFKLLFFRIRYELSSTNMAKIRFRTIGIY